MFNKNFITIFLLSWVISFSTVHAFEIKPEKTLIVFSADWCQFCKTANYDMKTDTKLIEVLKNYEIIILDYDVDKDAVQGYNIKTLPAFIILENNKEIKRKIGYKGRAKDLTQFLK